MGVDDHSRWKGNAQVNGWRACIEVVRMKELEELEEGLGEDHAYMYIYICIYLFRV